ncbi:hypothetical protein RHECNPAF_1700037 [Rhizobium etli CNPAF512]|nr:hypothetical protein RHECNPAF_1700037 [Rhizobium etli CNPAF512]
MRKEIEFDSRPDRRRLPACKECIDHEFRRHDTGMGVLDICFHSIPQSTRPICLAAPAAEIMRTFTYSTIRTQLTLSGAALLTERPSRAASPLYTDGC